MMNTYQYDMHVHTGETSPCGKVPAQDIVRMYKKAGYHGIVITDHYHNCFFEELPCEHWDEKVDRYLEGYRIAESEGKKLGLRVILGMELRFLGSQNDYLVFGVDESFLRKNPELYKLDLETFRRLATENGLLVIQAHPFRAGIIPAPPELLDGVEVYNGNMRHDSRNDLALAFAQKNNLFMVSGSDFHREEDLARGGIAVAGDITSSSQMADAIRSGKIKELIRS